MDIEKLLALLLVCEVFPEDVKFDSREVGKEGKKFTMRTQRAYFKQPGSRFPKEFKFTLPDSQQVAYPAGKYFIHPDSFTQGDFDALELSRFSFSLVAVPPDVAAKLPAWK